MNWQDLDPLIKILIATILCMMIAGWIGYIRYKFHEWLKKKEAEQKQEASEPIDSIPLVYDSKAQIKRMGHELRELTWERRR